MKPSLFKVILLFIWEGVEEIWCAVMVIIKAIIAVGIVLAIGGMITYCAYVAEKDIFKGNPREDTRVERTVAPESEENSVPKKAP